MTTMSVAEKSAEQRPAKPQQGVASQSFVLALYAFLALGFIFSFLPWAWAEFVQVQFATKNLILSNALLMVTALCAIGILSYVGYQLLQKNDQPGTRAGAFFLFATIFILAWMGVWLGGRFERELGTVGAVILLGLLAAGLIGVLALFRRPSFLAGLNSWEDGGWFHSAGFKPNQGVRVRRATVIGILVVGITGIITMVNHRGLSIGDWSWDIPFTGGNKELPLLSRLNVTVPILLGVALIWFAWRVVNYPVFADFLIATEAEMNKVSWTTRKRLVQDTIVVLVTVILMTAFLFFVDLLWIQILQGVNVLQVNLKAEQQRQQEKTQW